MGRGTLYGSMERMLAAGLVEETAERLAKLPAAAKVQADEKHIEELRENAPE